MRLCVTKYSISGMVIGVCDGPCWRRPNFVFFHRYTYDLLQFPPLSSDKYPLSLGAENQCF